MASGIVTPMTSGSFLSTASVVMLLVGVALLAGVSAVMVASFDRVERHRGKTLMVCLASIWAVAVLVIWLVKRPT
jgi:Ca2+/Na+ antiporter